MANVSDAVIKNLGTFLKANMALLQDVQYEWPNPNQTLKYPSVSVLPRNPNFKPQSNWVIWKGEEILTGEDAGKFPVKRIVGQYDYSLQLDFWCRSKPERANVIDQFILAFHRNPLVSGVSLQMLDYHDQWVHYSLDSIQTDTSDIESTRSEWRSIVTVLANCFCVIERNEYLIETIENNLELPPVIDTEETESGELII